VTLAAGIVGICKYNGVVWHLVQCFTRHVWRRIGGGGMHRRKVGVDGNGLERQTAAVGVVDGGGRGIWVPHNRRRRFADGHLTAATATRQTHCGNTKTVRTTHVDVLQGNIISRGQKPELTKRQVPTWVTSTRRRRYSGFCLGQDPYNIIIISCVQHQ